MRKMIAKFSGKCSGCAGRIKAGEPIMWEKSMGAYHEACAHGRTAQQISIDDEQDSQIAASERRLAAADEREYQAGIADAERYSFNKKVFGEELAERWEIEEEMKRGWDY